MSYSLSPIGHIRSPFKQKFAIPRQSQALSLAKGEIIFADHINPEQALDSIDAFSHLWILFLFHENLAKGFSDKVRPPRLGGNKKVGVFATRSPFRPNGIGMSLVTNLGYSNKTLSVGGIDLLDGTPIIDIKPYLPYADIQQNAQAGFANDTPLVNLPVMLNEHARQQISYFNAQHPDFEPLLINVLAQDPRPAYKKTSQDNKHYHISLYNADITWHVVNTEHTPSILVTAICKSTP